MKCTCCGAALARTNLRPTGSNAVYSDLFYCAQPGCEREGLAAYMAVSPDVPVEEYKREMKRLFGLPQERAPVAIDS